jgi:hypothetical protein
MTLDDVLRWRIERHFLGGTRGANAVAAEA